MAATRRTFSTRHGAVIADDSGADGFPVLMIHGSGSSRRVFDRQSQSPLGRKWRMIAVDLPGHGQSQNAVDPERSYTVAGLADCLGEIAGKLGLTRFAVFGWSLGGHVAVEMLAGNAGVAGAMVTGAPPIPPGLIGMLRGFVPSFDILLASREEYSERDAERFEWLCFGGAGAPGFRDMIRRADGRSRAIFVKSLQRGDGADQRHAVENASVPVALVNGVDDPFVRLNYMNGLNVPLLFEGHPQVIQGAGHSPFWQQPEAFNPIFDRFLDAVAANEKARERDVRRIA